MFIYVYMCDYVCAYMYASMCVCLYACRMHVYTIMHFYQGQMGSGGDRGTPGIGGQSVSLFLQLSVMMEKCLFP